MPSANSDFPIHTANSMEEHFGVAVPLADREDNHRQRSGRLAYMTAVACGRVMAANSCDEALVG
jgi:hypothetical protein